MKKKMASAYDKTLWRQQSENKHYITFQYVMSIKMMSQWISQMATDPYLVNIDQLVIQLIMWTPKLID